MNLPSRENRSVPVLAAGNHYAGSSKRGLFTVSLMFALIIPAALRGHENFIVKIVGDAFLVAFIVAAHHKPIIASAATLAGDFVARNQIGWTIPYQADALKSLLQQLIAEPQTLASVKAKCSQVALSHTWKARAQQVIHDMQGLPSPNLGASS